MVSLTTYGPSQYFWTCIQVALQGSAEALRAAHCDCELAQ